MTRIAKWIIAVMLGTGVTQGQTITVLHAFSGADGANPTTGLLRDRNGNLYGSTGWGGTHGWGTIFKVDSNNVESVLYSFTGGADGGYPTAVLLDQAGNLYGTESGGCDCYALGTVFKVDLDGKYTMLYAFTGGRDGSGPEAGLVRDAAGNLYGTTAYGGDLNTCVQSNRRLVTRSASYPPVMWPPNGCGTIFKLSPVGKQTVFTALGLPGGLGHFLLRVWFRMLTETCTALLHMVGTSFASMVWITVAGPYQSDLAIASQSGHI